MKYRLSFLCIKLFIFLAGCATYDPIEYIRENVADSIVESPATYAVCTDVPKGDCQEIFYIST